MVNKLFDKKSSGSGVAASLANKSTTEPNYQLAKELHKQVTRKLKKRKVYSPFRHNTWGFHLADMQSLNKYNKGIKYLLCTIDLFSKYLWVALLKDKRGIAIVNEFEKKIKNDANQIKYGSINVVNFTINLLRDFLKYITLKCIQHTMTENLLVLKDLLGR